MDFMDFNEMRATHEKQIKRIQKCDADAKKAGSLIGRYIVCQVADGKAFYMISKENKKTVRIQLVEGIMDELHVQAWGEMATINKEQALDMIRRREAMDKLFKGG